MLGRLARRRAKFQGSVVCNWNAIRKNIKRFSEKLRLNEDSRRNDDSATRTPDARSIAVRRRSAGSDVKEGGDRSW